MNYLAKPTGIFLEDHLDHVLQELSIILKLSPSSISKYREITGESLFSLARFSARWHDEGKKEKTWQDACRRDFEVDPQAKVVKNLKGVGIRHELVSLVYAEKDNVNLGKICKSAIASHHGKLGEHAYSLGHWQRFEKFWCEFKKESNSVQHGEIEKAVYKRYTYDGPRSLLQQADHRASALEAGDPYPEIKPFSYCFPHKEYRGVQRLVSEIWDLPFVLLKAPTGSGKTDACLIWAKRQIEAARADRLIIAMPTRFTVNAVGISVTKNLSSLGIYHSTSWINNKSAGSTKAIKEQEIAKLLISPVTITTIDHLLLCLTGSVETHHTAFFNLANSCLVIDEADFYDTFTQENIVVLLMVLRILDVPVLIMSATLPSISKKTYARSGFSSKIYTDKSQHKEVNLEFDPNKLFAEPKQVAGLLEENGDKPAIVYVNTVDRAIRLYRYLKKFDIQKEVVVYHSRFTEPDKVEKEKKLIELLGQKAWENGIAHGIAILTQIGEVSVNISADFMISDLCPADRLIQRIGRLSRFRSRTPGVIKAIVPAKATKKGTWIEFPAPYGNYQPGSEWVALPSYIKTKDLLRSNSYSPEQFDSLIDKVFSDNPIISSHAQANARRLQDYMVYNWLIVPKQPMQQTDDFYNDWKSRDCEPQRTVLVKRPVSAIDPENNFDFLSWRKYKEFELKYGVSIYSYQFNNLLDSNKLENFTIEVGKDVTTLFIIAPHFYNSEVGLLIEE